MKQTITTVEGTSNSNTCLICDTTYSVGKPILPQPKCKCGNISFFDITPHYVRIGINWLFLKVENKNNWKEITLNEIKKYGEPQNLVENPKENSADFLLSNCIYENSRT